MKRQKEYIYNVFISYSHKDKDWVRDWLLPKLEEAGLQVCIDFRNFDIGVPSLVNMEQAVDRSRYILLVLTPDWVDSEWTVFESLLIQTADPSGQRQRMMPLLLKHCAPPPRIAMLTYADFTDYGEHDAQLKRVLAGVSSKTRKLDESVPLGRLLYKTADVAPKIGRKILSFDALIADKTEGFVGRQFVFDAFDAFLREEPCGYFVIRGDPGIGKTAVMGQLVKTLKPVHHFNVVQQNIRTPEQFLTNICAQIIGRYQLTRLEIPDEPMKDSTFLVNCLEAAAADPANRPLILALDALDEADWRWLPPRVNVHYLPPVLPEGVFVVTSTRPVKDIPLEVVRRRDLDIEQDSEGNLLDIRTHLEVFAKQSDMQSKLASWEIDAETFVIELLHKSQGNFMYLDYVLPAIKAGKLDRSGVGKLPEGLQAYYKGHWAMMREEVGGTFEETHERVICVLAVMNEPVSMDDVAEWTKLQRHEVQRIVQAWEQFLFKDVVGGERLYRIYHASFAEFLGKQVDLRDFSELVIDAIEEKAARAMDEQ